MKMRAFVLTVAVVLAAGGAASVHAAETPIPPAPTRWVTDQVGFISPATRAQLDARLEAYQRATGHQVVVWIGDSIGDRPLDEWAVRTFEAWKVGRRGVDDGLAMFVLASDRKIDIEVGYGLEGQVPDAIARRVVDGMAERIRAGDHDGAVSEGVEALLTAIEGQPFPGRASAPAPELPPRRPPPGAGAGQKILFGIVGLVFLILFITNPRMAMVLLWSMMSRGGHVGGGGWSGGGGGGGFQGGGGRSGGGGARGGW